MAKFRLSLDGDNMARIARNLTVVLGVALLLAACGRKSDLERPAPPPNISKDAGGKSANPDRPFILDPLVKSQ